MTAITLSTVTSALVSACGVVARAEANALPATDAWARFCAQGLVGKKPSLTLEGISAAIVTAVNGKRGKASSLTDLVKAGGKGGTAASRFYMLRRIALAGDAQLVRLIGDATTPAESLFTVGRGISSTTANKGKSPSKGKPAANDANTDEATPLATAPVPSEVSMTLASVARYLVAMRKSGDIAMIEAQQKHLSVIMAESGNLARMVEAAVAARAKAAAEKPAKRVRKAA